MFIFIDNELPIETERVIAILDYQLLKTSSKLLNLMEQKRKEHLLFGIENGAKSIVITDKELYFSPLSTITLKKREHFFSPINQIENY